jgi:hypothetical protein
VLHTPRHTWKKGLLNSGVEIAVGNQERQRSILQDGSEELSNTGGEGDGSEVRRKIWGLLCSCLGNHTDNPLLSTPQDQLLGPIDVEDV